MDAVLGKISCRRSVERQSMMVENSSLFVLMEETSKLEPHAWLGMPITNDKGYEQMGFIPNPISELCFRSSQGD